MTKNSKSNKLKLSTESLRRLAGEDLRKVNGGAAPVTDPCLSVGYKGCTQSPCR